MIAKLKALEAKAHPGPWTHNGCAAIDGPIVWQDVTMHIYDEGGHSPDDAAFIVALRNLAPQLIALWESCNAMQTTWDSRAFVSNREALRALNAKATEVLEKGLGNNG